MVMKLTRRLIYRYILEEDINDKPCSKVGHSHEKTGVVGYHTYGVPYFGFGTSFKVKRKDREECPKCGDVRFPKTYVGKIRVDKETDELTVVQ